ncbi:MAG: hypothetical protein E7632_12845 [Ruminococcaceae bacterium]|nr:hypothetical protein [Oscillospiraceae bacterium]
MKTIIMNYIYIFILPIIVGITIRILTARRRFGFLVTAGLAILAVIGWCIAAANPIPGNEFFGILAIQESMACAASLVLGGVLTVRARLKRSK